MKKVSIIMIVIGIALLLFGIFFYGHKVNMVDSGGSSNITTLNGNWSVEIPAYFGGVMLVLGLIFFYIDKDIKSKHYHA